MTEHYVTLFDSVFLPQGLALYHSLIEHGGDCLLWVLCLDDTSFKTLHRLDLPQVRLLNLAEVETTELLSVKAGRSCAEYCWTLTPWSIQWVFEADPSVQRVTYLDADVFFLKSPSPFFDEFDSSGRAFLITEHGFAPEYDRTATAGRYCVQFLTVVREAGFPVLYWWRDSCIAWCFARYQDNMFGDQKYLESFSKLFPDLVYAIAADSRLQAPWNATIFRYSDAILYHFQGLRIISTSLMFLSGYSLTVPHLQYVYLPYCRLLRKLILSQVGNFLPQSDGPGFIASMQIRLLKRLRCMLLGSTYPPFYFISSQNNASLGRIR
jgi:hypothetical protein